MYQTILFDLDGTLTDSKLGITKSLQYALGKVGIFIHDISTLEKFIGPPLQTVFQEQFGFQDDKVKVAIEHYRFYFAKEGIFENSVYTGILDLLQRLQKKNKVLAVATSKPQTFAEQILHHFNLTTFFTHIQGATLDGNLSRKGDIIFEVIKKLSDRPNMPTVMIGDRKHDIIGAQENEIDSIGVLYGYGSKEEIQEAKPTYIAQTMDELSALLLR